jgi:hypothetical protein
VEGHRADGVGLQLGRQMSARRPWAAWEIKLLREAYGSNLTEHLALVLDRPIAHVYAKANHLGLTKGPDFQASSKSGRILKGGKLSVATQFKPGQAPANKGLRRPGWAPGRMAATQFKPGTMPHTWVPVGSYRINSDGYLDRKVNDLPGPSHVRWHPVHRLAWIEANGPVPPGRTVVFKPGRRTTELDRITADAVECITRAELMARNTIHRMPPQLADVARLRGRLVRAINDRAKEAESDD